MTAEIEMLGSACPRPLALADETLVGTAPAKLVDHMRLHVAIALLWVAAVGCTGPVDSGVSLDDHLLAAPSVAAAAYLEVERSPVFPFCNATLLGPRQAVTPRACVASLAPSRIIVHGPKPTDWGGVRTESIRYADDLAVLTLAADGARAPVKLTTPSEGTCDLRVEGYAHGASNSEPKRLSWEGCLADSEDGLLHVDLMSGTDFCHHSSGASVFLGNDLVGVVVGAESHDGCATTLHALPAHSVTAL